MDDPGKIWDQLLASAQTQGNTETLHARSTCRLPLKSEPAIEQQPTKPRLLSLIPADLRSSIRGCIAGELPWPLVWTGATGTGKTCAALCLLDYSGGRYWAAADLGDDLRRAEAGRLTWNKIGHSGTHYPEDIWNWITRAALVVFDELGCRDRVSDFQYETAKRVLDKREGKPLIVISNLTLERLEELYDDRFVSRLAEGTVLEVDGVDRRLKQPIAPKAPKRKSIPALNGTGSPHLAMA